MKKTAIVVLLLVLRLGNVHSQGNDRDPASAHAKVEIPGSQLLKITSSIVGQEYDVYVQMPGNYSDTNKTFPVLYVLDGQWDLDRKAHV